MVEDSGEPKEPYVRWGSRSPMGMGNFEGERGVPLLSLGTLCGHLCKNGSTNRDAVWFVGSDAPLPGNHVLDGGPQVLRDVAMAASFWLSIGYNFGCMIASHTLFGTKVAITGFV